MAEYPKDMAYLFYALAVPCEKLTLYSGKAPGLRGFPLSRTHSANTQGFTGSPNLDGLIPRNS